MQYLNITRNEELFEFPITQVSIDILVDGWEDFLVKLDSILPACSILIHFQGLNLLFYLWLPKLKKLNKGGLRISDETLIFLLKFNESFNARLGVLWKHRTLLYWYLTVTNIAFATLVEISNKQWYHCIGWQLRGFMGNFVLFLFFLSDPTWWPLFWRRFFMIYRRFLCRYRISLPFVTNMSK